VLDAPVDRPSFFGFTTTSNERMKSTLAKAGFSRQGRRWKSRGDEKLWSILGAGPQISSRQNSASNFRSGISAVKKNQNQAKKSESVEPANQNPLVRPIQNPIFAPESSYS